MPARSGSRNDFPKVEDLDVELAVAFRTSVHRMACATHALDLLVAGTRPRAPWEVIPARETTTPWSAALFARGLQQGCSPGSGPFCRDVLSERELEALEEAYDSSGY